MRALRGLQSAASHSVSVSNAEVLQILVLYKNYIEEFKKTIKKDKIGGAN
jgi:hypothetical protein